MPLTTPDPDNAGGGERSSYPKPSAAMVFFMIPVFANGNLEGDGEWIRPFLAQSTAIIAADGGSRHLHALNHPPDIIIGDMDSLPAAVRRWLTAVGTQFITHPPAKNETDLELALRYAVEKYDADILLFTALGGRLDQMLANIHLLAHPAFAGRVRLISPHQQTWVMAAPLTKTAFMINGRVGDTLSLIPLHDAVKVNSTAGLQYPLHEEFLYFDQSRGISNVLTAETAVVTIEKGSLLCVLTEKEWGR